MRLSASAEGIGNPLVITLCAGLHLCPGAYNDECVM